MNKSNERTVLISMKISTLMIIWIILIVLISGIVLVKNSEYEQISLADSTDIKEEINVENTSPSPEDIKEQYERRTIAVTSRFSETREEAVVEENEQEEVINEQESIEAVQEELVVTSTPIEEVKISKDMDLTVRTGLSREDFITLIAGVKADTSGFFEENSGLIYDVCEKYQINEIFFCGLISAESGWTIASNHRNTHNYISLMSSRGLIRFASVEDGMEQAAKTLHDKYLTPGGAFYYGPTLAGVKTKFCPASSTWVNLVYQRMDQII